MRKSSTNYYVSLHSDPPVSSNQSASEFDLELIFGTFPGGTDFLGQAHGHTQAHLQGQGQGQGQGATNIPLDIDSILDPFFGFMGAPFMPTPPGNLGTADAGDLVGEKQGTRNGEGNGEGCFAAHSDSP